MLKNNIQFCTRCELHRGRRRTVESNGDPNVRIMLIGQAPGEEEERHNRLFVGPGGAVLDELLATAGLSRSDVYITNLLKCRLPGNRRPKMFEIATCGTFLTAEIQIVKPELIAPLGYYATKAIFERFGLGNPRRDRYRTIYGRIFRVGDLSILPLQNPASLIPAPETRGEVMGNYSRLQEALGASV